jgi:hypothetical protein
MQLPPRTRRLIRALLASSGTGAVLLWLATRYALPRLAVSLTPTQRKSLGDAFANHPYWVMTGIAGVAAVCALPVLLVFRLVYGPLRD